MLHPTILFFTSLLTTLYAQQVGTYIPEVHPALSWSTCTTSGGCVTQSGKVVLDADSRWLHAVNSTTNCYTGNEWAATICPDPVTCTASCALEGADYAGSFGVTTSGNALSLKFIQGTNMGSRVYLMANDTKYQIFNPNNQEISFTVDVSQVPCGINGALYLTEMAADGGMAAHPTNKAGAAYGTGYCDSQCPRNLKFINGQANILDWTATSADDGTGLYGACCSEMDVWQSNSIATVYTAHPCTNVGLAKCSGSTCTTYCDQAGCDFNSYRMGNTTFYGTKRVVDTSIPFTVVTQFITADGTATGPLTGIRRLYVQSGVTIQNSVTNIPGLKSYNSISDQFCTDQKAITGDPNTFAADGGLTATGQSLARGAVMVFSISNDPYGTQMLWLDSDWPITAPATQPGVARGTCSANSGTLPITEVVGASSRIYFSNIKFGDIGSTYTGSPYVPPPTAS
ncbi:hypothetical protein FRB94_012771 [Tulasnella sp. JGI-2019a]|nr:hypothetical protein FRB94_012771 [Tulasnella sp. JGI-2019a]KAG9018484.1 hypothetical protein FRB93_000187 [Tulasnella sp. JGI-2019a]KAG9037475.1 hypothetical protein FRB95_005414 [Tulasnella sp. JGI-2019a]